MWPVALGAAAKAHAALAATCGVAKMNDLLFATRTSLTNYRGGRLCLCDLFH